MALDSSAWCQQVISLLTPPDTGCLPLLFWLLYRGWTALFIMLQHVFSIWAELASPWVGMIRGPPLIWWLRGKNSNDEVMKSWYTVYTFISSHAFLVMFCILSDFVWIFISCNMLQNWGNIYICVCVYPPRSCYKGCRIFHLDILLLIQRTSYLKVFVFKVSSFPV